MKILLATESYYPNIDGGAIAQHNLVTELKKLGHDVNVLAPGNHFKNYTEEINGVNVYRTRSITLPFYMNNRYRFSPFPLFRVNKIIKNLKPDVVQICSPYPIGCCAYLVARKNNVPVLSSIHILPENMLSPFLKSRYYGKLEKRLWSYLVYFFNLADWITIPTETGAKMFTDHGLKNKITPISNGVNTEVFKPDNDGRYLRDRYKLPAENVIIYTGRISQEKNLDVLINAIPFVINEINAHFLFVGSGGEYKNKLLSLVDKLNVDKHTTFTDFLDWQDYPNIYSIADLFTLPAESELQSIVTLEALASGLPVVVVNKGAIPELANYGNGFVFEPRNSEEMASKIVKILCDENLKKQMGTKSLGSIKKHNLKSVALQYAEIYEKVIKLSNS
jgi:glycosyltransferase involved in cell wall biosynthesis